MIRVGVMLAFRSLCQGALNEVLDRRVPYLLSSIKDLHHHEPVGREFMIVHELASSAGEKCPIDPVLWNILRNMKSSSTEKGPNKEDYTIACLLLVFVAVSIPKLSQSDLSTYKAFLGGHLNNSHCLAKSINTLTAVLFSLSDSRDISLRLKEFLMFTSSSVLYLGIENDKETMKNRESVFLLLDQIVQESPYLTMDVLESCFPYALLRNAYHSVYKSSATEL
ncbi:unnamed protein product [Lymnaea stagnalis]|uniref:Huntingtin n=1 Tax=Lymnaea stagnalis TaxID=6523 RepID=A0AAV2HM21_LYMST